MARQFALSGSAVIKKIQISAAARQQLQNLVINVDVSKVQAALSQLGVQIQNVFRPIQKAGTSAAGLKNVANAINGVTNAANRASGATKKMDSLFVQVLRKATAFRVSTIAINGFFNAINDGIRFTVAFDSALRDTNKILKLNDDNLKLFGADIIKMAGQFNRTAEELATVAKIAAQAGFFDFDTSQADKARITLDLQQRLPH